MIDIELELKTDEAMDEVRALEAQLKKLGSAQVGTEEFKKLATQLDTAREKAALYKSALDGVDHSTKAAASSVKAATDRTKEMAEAAKALAEQGKGGKNTFLMLLGGEELPEKVGKIQNALEAAGNSSHSFGTRAQSLVGGLGMLAQVGGNLIGTFTGLAAAGLEAYQAHELQRVAVLQLGAGYEDARRATQGLIDATQLLADKQALLRAGLAVTGQDLGTLELAGQQYAATYGGTAAEAMAKFAQALQSGDTNTLAQFGVQLSDAELRARDLQAALTDIRNDFSQNGLIPDAAVNSAANVASRALDRLRNGANESNDLMQSTSGGDAARARRAQNADRLASEQQYLRVLQDRYQAEAAADAAADHAWAEQTERARLRAAEESARRTALVRDSGQTADQVFRLSGSLRSVANELGSMQWGPLAGESDDQVMNRRLTVARNMARAAGEERIEREKIRRLLMEEAGEERKRTGHATMSQSDIDNVTGHTGGPGMDPAAIRELATEMRHLMELADRADVQVKARMQSTGETLLHSLRRQVEEVELHTVGMYDRVLRHRGEMEDAFIRRRLQAAQQALQQLAEAERGKHEAAMGYIEEEKNAYVAALAKEVEVNNAMRTQVVDDQAALEENNSAKRGAITEMSEAQKEAEVMGTLGNQLHSAFSDAAGGTLTAAEHMSRGIVGAVSDVTTAFGASMNAVREGKAEFGAAMQQMAKDALAALSSRAVAESLAQFAAAFGALATYRYAEAGQHFISGGIWAAVAGISGGISAAIPSASTAAGAAAGAGGFGSAPRAASAVPPSNNSQAGGATYVFNVQGFAATEEGVQRAIVRSLDLADENGARPRFARRPA